MFTQEIFLAALALATGAIALINNLIKEGDFIHNTHKKDSALLEFADQVRYFSENSRDNCRNSLIFKQMTGRRAPIRTINLILNCYDPHLATYIYAKAPRYVRFQRDDIENWQLEEPGILRGWLVKGMLWLMLMAAAVLSILSILTLIVMGTRFQAIAQQSTNLGLYVASLTIFSLIALIAIFYGRYAYKELKFIDLVRTFYRHRPPAQRKLIRSVFNGAIANTRQK